MEKQIEKLEIAMMEQKKDIQYIKRDLDKIYNKLTAFIEHADKKFAKKWVEEALSWGLKIIIGAIIIAILGLVLVNTKTL